jgi:hypothetical protein
MRFVIVQMATGRMTIRLQKPFAVGMEDNLFMPQRTMVLPLKIKSVLKLGRLLTTANGGSIV